MNHLSGGVSMMQKNSYSLYRGGECVWVRRWGGPPMEADPASHRADCHPCRPIDLKPNEAHTACHNLGGPVYWSGRGARGCVEEGRGCVEEGSRGVEEGSGGVEENRECVEEDRGCVEEGSGGVEEGRGCVEEGRDNAKKGEAGWIEVGRKKVSWRKLCRWWDLRNHKKSGEVLKLFVLV